MQCKVFEAEDMATALRKVKEQLGPDAIIMSTKTVRRGKMGIFNKPMLEITAAREPDKNNSDGQKNKKRCQPSVNSDTVNKVYKENQNLIDDNTVGNKTRQFSDQLIYSSSDQQKEENGYFQTIHGEISELRQMMENFRHEFLSKKDLASQDQSARAVDFEPKNPILKEALSIGLNGEVAEYVAQKTKEILSSEQELDQDIINTIAHVLADSMDVYNPILDRKTKEKRRVALIGPTGVGKTTTLAKLAANYMGKISPHIALVTIDNYRIAAVEQLKIYAEIMNIDLEVVNMPEKIEEIMNKHQDKDLILIDTAGRSHKDATSLEELNSFLTPTSKIENYLVLSATTREEDMQRVVQNFGNLPLSGLIFTKLDECEDFGSLFNIHYKNRYPLCYLTNGQKVPEDLIIPDSRYIADLIVTPKGQK